MKKQMFAAALLLTTTGSVVAAEWQTLPFKDPNWSPDFTVAVTAGPMDVDVSGLDSDTATGLQLSLNCPWFSPPKGTIRQQFNYNMFDDGNAEVTTFELNPHWYVGDEKLSYGAGPGIGYVWVKPNGGSETSMWAFQLSADVEYRMGKLFIGAGTRYQITQDKDLGGGESGANNLLTQIKVGINF